MNIRSAIQSQFLQVAQEQGYTLAPLTEGLQLLDTGLDSLSFAIIVTRLEALLDVDPFSDSEDFVFPATFGDLVDIYERAVQHQ